MTPLALVTRLRALPPEVRAEILASLPARQIAALRFSWEKFWARPDVRQPGGIEGTGQLPPPGDWDWWANIGGRGTGKTRTCAEWINGQAKQYGPAMIVNLLGATVDDARKTMIEDESGLLQTAPPWCMPQFFPSKGGGTVEWPNGAKGRLFGAVAEGRARGPQCSHMWIDDPAAFGKKGKAVVDTMILGHRKKLPDGAPARGVISSTDIDSDVLDWIMSGADGKSALRIVYSRSESDDNLANLSPNFLRTLGTFAGTAFEAQERYGRRMSSGRIFEGVDFTKAPIRVASIPKLVKIAISIDPTTTAGIESCEVGIIAGGLDAADHAYALQDASGVMRPDEWPVAVLELVDDLRAAHVVIEINKGGKMGPELLRSAEKLRRARAGKPAISVLEIREVVVRPGETKARRAAPLRPLYLAGQIHHDAGLVDLERQLVALRDGSERETDRADAWIHLVRDLLQIAEVGEAPTDPTVFDGMKKQNAKIGSWGSARSIGPGGSGNMPKRGRYL